MQLQPPKSASPPPTPTHPPEMTLSTSPSTLEANSLTPFSSASRGRMRTTACPMSFLMRSATASRRSRIFWLSRFIWAPAGDAADVRRGRMSGSVGGISFPMLLPPPSC